MAEKILVVDDEPDVAETIAEVVRGAGYDADVRTNSVAALERLSAVSYDLIVSDLVMPGLDGLQLLTLVKARDNPPEVILITAHSSEEVAKAALKHGAFAYVEKPFDADDLVARTKQALWKRYLSSAARDRADG